MKQTNGGGASVSRLIPDQDIQQMSRPPYSEVTDNLTETILEPAYQAIMSNNFDALKKLKIKNGFMIFWGHEQQLAIDLAIEKGNIKIIQYLFDKGAIPIDAGVNPLQRALAYTNADIEIVKLVLNQLTGGLSHIKKQNIAEQQSIDSDSDSDTIYFDKIKYNKETKLSIMGGFMDACRIGRLDIIELFMSKDLIDLADKDVGKRVLIYLLSLFPENVYRQYESTQIGEREALYKILEYILQNGAKQHVAMAEEAIGSGWDEHSNEHSIRVDYTDQPIIGYIISTQDPMVVSIFMQNGLKPDDIIDEEDKDEINRLLDESNKSIIPEITAKMHTTTGQNVEPNLSHMISQYVAGGKRKTKKSNKKCKKNTKKKQSKKRATRKRT